MHEYEVWGRLGGGGMSDVYLGRHLHLSMPVIVKTLKPSVDAGPAERAERMRTEALLTARIRSPRLVRPLDVGVFEDVTPYLVQDYVDGVDLGELDQGRRRALGLGLPLWFVAETVAEVAQALAAAHRTGVLHRDLKPANLFLSPEEGVKLGDFGVAMARRAPTASKAELAGTLEYMAPETLARGEFHRATDVYGLGATAFHLRYGRPPYGSMAEVLNPEVPPGFPPRGDARGGVLPAGGGAHAGPAPRAAVERHGHRRARLPKAHHVGAPEGARHAGRGQGHHRRRRGAALPGG